MLHSVDQGHHTALEMSRAVTMALQREKIYFDASILNHEAVSAGTCNIFPKDQTIHRGVSKGSNPGYRYVIYFTLCRKSALKKYQSDRAESSEYSRI
jgi:hypothetical protein